MSTRELGRWLSDKEHFLLLQRTRVWFLPPSSWLTTAWNSSSQESSTFSWLRWDPHTYDACELMQAHTIHFFFNLYYPWTKEREYSGATPGCKSHSLLKCNLTTTLLVQAHRRKNTHTRIFSAAFICSSKKLAVFKTFNKKTMVQCILLCSYSGLL